MKYVKRNRGLRVVEESRFKELADFLPEPVFETDISGKILQVNQLACDMLGYEREMLVGRQLADISSPQTPGEIDLRMKEVLAEGQSIFEMENVCKDGTLILVEVHTRVIELDGKPAFLSIVRDISERKSANDLIHRRNRQLEILSRASTEINSVLDITSILRTLVKSAMELVDATGGMAGVVSDGKMVFKEYNDNGNLIPIDVVADKENGVPGLVMKTKRHYITNDAGNDKYIIDEFRKDMENRKLVNTPIFDKHGNVLGCFEIFDPVGGREFEESDVDLLKGLSASASIAIENAGLLNERLRAESASRESEEKFRALVESALVGVYIIQDEKYAYVNPAMARIFGYTQDELLSKHPVFDVIFPADQEMVFGNFRKRIAGETDAIRYVFRGVRKDGQVIDLEVLGARAILNGKPGIIGTLIDITERKFAEEKLRDSEEKYRNLFKESVDVIYISSPEGKILDINPAGVKLFGYESADDLLALENIDIVYEDPEYRRKFVDRLARQGFVRDFETRVRRKDGEVVTVLDSASVVRNSEGKIIAYSGILRDITERRRLEEQLLQSQKLESLGQLTSGIAHDFNNVLGGIIGFTELAIGKIEEDHIIHNYLLRIYGLADRAAKITKQLLAFARRQILMQKDLDLNELLNDLFQLLPRLPRERSQIIFIPGTGLKMVHADPSQIEQVIMNLAVNADDAMPKGGTITIETQNVFLDEHYCREHTNVQPGDYVMIVVSDTGSGIDSAVIKRIFEPFFTTKDIGKGTGLGLAVAHGIIRQHGGSISVYSELGKGTTFKIYLPVVEGEAELLTRKPEIIEQPAKGKETVLIVEDNEELREFIETLLSDNGYSVVTASEGEEAIKIYETHGGAISLVVTDLVMPKMSGKELREKIGSRHPDTKFLFISGYTESTIHHGFMVNSKVDFLQKPFTTFELLGKVRKILDNSPQR